MAVPYTFGSATSSIPLSQLDSNFATGITLGNTTVYLGNTTTSFGNVSLTNVTISSVSTAITPAQGGTGLITIPANNVILGNGTSNVAVVAPGTSGNVLTSNGTTWSSATISAASVSAAGSTTQVQYNNAGAFAGSANLTFNGTTLTAAGLAGPFNGTVGATTANTGAFTTLSASSTVSGTGFSTYLASPPAIGGTAAAAGTFTTLTTSSTITDNGGTANGVTYLNGSKVVTSGSALTFDGSLLNVTSFGGLRSTVTGGAYYTSYSIDGVYANGTDLYLYAPTGKSVLFYSNNAEAMRLTSSSLYTASGINVGFGASNPLTRLSITSVANAPSPTLGTPSGGFSLLGSAGLYGIYAGVSDSGNTWIQAMRNNTATAYDLLLQPSGGNVGIGTSSPGEKLEVSGNIRMSAVPGTNTNTAFPILFQISTGTIDGGSGLTYNPGGDVMSVNGMSISASSCSGSGSSATFTCANGSGQYDFVATSDSLRFTAGSSEAARFDSTRNFMVGTTTNAINDSNSIVLVRNNGSVVGQVICNHGTGTGSGERFAAFGYAGSSIGSITQNGTTAVAYNTSSDYRLKENIQDAESSSSLIDAIQVRQFDWKSDGSHQRYGFIAQELVTVAPEAVHQPTDTDEMMAVDYSKLVPMLVKEIQSLRQRLSAANL